MRIDAMSRVYGAYEAQAVTKVKSQEKVQGKDEVALSKEAKDFATVMKKLSSVPEVRQDKVDVIKEQIASQSYSVKSEEVAEKVLSQLDIRG